MMKLIILCSFLALLIIAAFAVPTPDLLPDQPVAAGAPYVRVVRANPQLKKDLEGSESGYYAAYHYTYPHYYWPSPYVFWGK